MKILVTGVAGMLGSSLTPMLQEEGHKVYATDIDLSDKKMKLLDVREIKQVEKWVKKISPNLIMHLAAETDLEECEDNPDHAYLTNTVGVQNVALLCGLSKILCRSGSDPKRYETKIDNINFI